MPPQAEHPVTGEYTGFFAVFGFGEIATFIFGMILASFLHGLLVGRVYDLVNDERTAELITSFGLLSPTLLYAYLIWSGRIPVSDVSAFFGNIAGGVFITEIGNIIEELTAIPVAGM